MESSRDMDKIDFQARLKEIRSERFPVADYSEECLAILQIESSSSSSIGSVTSNSITGAILPLWWSNMDAGPSWTTVYVSNTERWRLVEAYPGKTDKGRASV